MKLLPPKNSKSLALYLLLENGIKGYTSFQAVKSDSFFKFNTRISDLILDYGLSVHKKLEKGSNRWGHPHTHIRYCLYTSDLKKNLELYKKLNVDK